jgi:outer membrane protein assembly factor BamB
MRVRHGVTVAGLLTAMFGMTAVGSGGPAAAEPPPFPSVTPAWTHDGYGPGNGGFNPDENWLAPSRVGRLEQQWSIPATGDQVCAHQAAPVTDGGAIFVPGRESISAFDADTAEKIWTYPYADAMDTRTPPLAVYSGVLLVATSGCQSVSAPSGELLALDAATGKLRWKARTSVPNVVLAVDDGVAVVAGGNAEWMATTAFSIATGKQLWQHPLATPAAGATTQDTLLLTGHDSVFRAEGTLAVDIRTGKVRWRDDHAWSVRAADYTGHSFLVDDAAGALLKVNATSGKIDWTARGLGGPLAVDRGQIYVASGTDLVSLTADTGRETWRRHDAASTLRPVVAAGVVYTLSPQNRLETLNAADGHPLGFTTGYKPADHPVVNDGWLYLTDGDQLRGYTAPRPDCCVLAPHP